MKFATAGTLSHKRHGENVQELFMVRTARLLGLLDSCKTPNYNPLTAVSLVALSRLQRRKEEEPRQS
jgi:hypothetical protein